MKFKVHVVVLCNLALVESLVGSNISVCGRFAFLLIGGLFELCILPLAKYIENLPV